MDILIKLAAKRRRLALLVPTQNFVQNVSRLLQTSHVTTCHIIRFTPARSAILGLNLSHSFLPIYLPTKHPIPTQPSTIPDAQVTNPAQTSIRSSHLKLTASKAQENKNKVTAHLATRMRCHHEMSNASSPNSIGTPCKQFFRLPKNATLNTSRHPSREKR